MLSPGLLIAVAAAIVVWLVGRSLAGAARWGAGELGHRTESELAQMFVFIPAARLLVLTAVIAVVSVAAALLLQLPMVLLPLILAVALAAPRLLVLWLRHRWRCDLARQLPDALSLWAGLLRAGQGASQALTQVASRQRAPLGDELRMVLAQLRLSAGLDVAFQGLWERSQLADLRLLSTLLQANRELGGNLAEPLGRLAELLRSRLVMQARIQSLTAQGKLQGIVVGALPLLLMAVLYVMEGDTMRALHTTPQGWAALAVIAVLELSGFLLIRRIVRIDV